jgi:hypothetical protein
VPSIHHTKPHPKLDRNQVLSSMSWKHPFEPLELRPFSRLDIADLGIDDTMASQPHFEPNSTEKVSPSLTTLYLPDGDTEGKNQSQPKLSSTTTINHNPAARYAPVHGSYRDQDEWLHSQNESLRTSLLQRKRQRFASTWVTAVLSVIISAFGGYYAYRVMVDEKALPSYLQLQPGTTVLVVNVLSHVVAFLCYSLFRDTMEALRWALACRPEGILLTSFLAMSRATPTVGVLYLLVTKGPHQIWALQRYGSSHFLSWSVVAASGIYRAIGFLAPRELFRSYRLDYNTFCHGRQNSGSQMRQ